MNTITELPGGGEKRGNIRFLRIVLGAGLAAILLTLIFLVPGKFRTPEFGSMIFSYLLVPTAGALGGLIVDMTQPIREKGGAYYFLSVSISTLLYAALFSVSYFMGTNGLN